MSTLLRFLGSLGPSGAVANAAALLDQRRHEDRIVASVVRHVGTIAAEPVATPTAA